MKARHSYKIIPQHQGMGFLTITPNSHCLLYEFRNTSVIIGEKPYWRTVPTKEASDD